MKRSMFLGSCALATLMGCNSQTPTASPTASAGTASVETGDSSAAKFVSLKVPNMH